MFAVKNKHLILSFFAFITIFLFLSNLTNQTNGAIDLIYPKRSSQPNEISYENLLDLMIEKFRENFIMTEVMKPVSRYIQAMK